MISPYSVLELSQEANRYNISPEMMAFYMRHLHPSEKMFLLSVGQTMAPLEFAVAKELYGVDIEPAVIKKTYKFMYNWQEYRNIEPFKTMFDFLEKRGTNPNFNIPTHFYLRNEMPEMNQNSFDGYAAIEVLLHLDPKHSDEWCRPQRIFEEAGDLLKKGGRFVFTIYSTGAEERLDVCFQQLTNGILNPEKYFDGRYLDIAKISEAFQNKELSEETKEQYWFDLVGVRMYSEDEIEQMSQGFNIIDKENIKGLMFRDADCDIYTLEKR